jgi:hypothetical protein
MNLVSDINGRLYCTLRVLKNRVLRRIFIYTRVENRQLRKTA